MRTGSTARHCCRILADEDAAAAAARLRACSLPPEAAASSGAAAGAAAGDTLVAFLACWAEHATDTRGPFQMRLSAAVLARLLAGKIAEVSQAQVRCTARCLSARAHASEYLGHACLTLPDYCLCGSSPSVSAMSDISAGASRSLEHS